MRCRRSRSCARTWECRAPPCARPYAPWSPSTSSRSATDTALAEPVTQTWKNRQDTELDQIVAQMDVHAQKGELFTEQDRRFHIRLLEPLDNHLFLHLTEAFWAVHTLTVPLLGAPRPEDMLSAARAHRTMLQAARAGDTQAYREAITDHYAPLLAALT